MRSCIMTVYATSAPTADRPYIIPSHRIADAVKKPPIQDAVEKATSEMLLQPDWENNLIICDAIEQKHDL